MELTVERARATPGEPTHLTVRVRNDEADPVSCVVRVLGLDDEWVQPPVAAGPIAPGTTAVVLLQIELPLGFPASRQAVAVVAETLDSPPRSLHAQTEIVVGDGHDLQLRLEPSDVFGGNAARLDVRVLNRSDEHVEVRLGSDAPAEHLRIDFEHGSMSLPPGSVGRTRATVRARSRPISGQSRHLPFAIMARGPLTPTRATGSFTQRPRFSSNLLKITSVLVLLALWASVMVAGLQYFDNDDDEPVSGDPAAATLAEDGGGDAGGGGGGGDAAAGDAAAGAAGEQAAGAEAPEESANGVRIGGTVQARDPGGVTVRLEPVSLVEESAQTAMASSGVPRSISAGKQAGPSTSTAGRGLAETRTTTTDAGGAWAFAGVPNPGFYLVTFTKPGFASRSHVLQTTDDPTPVVLDVVMEAGQGVISGTVLGPSGPMGGVAITVSDGTLTYGTETPTSGEDVGEWSVEGVSTPGTYLVTATRDGWGTQTGLIELESGGSGSVNLTMEQGVATVTGLVTSAESGVALANIEVTVTDGTVTRTATSLSEGLVGSYALPQLPIPGTYTITAAGDGFVTATQQIELTGNAVVPIPMEAATGVVEGFVTGPDGVALVGAGVTLTNGDLTMKNTSVAPRGRYEISGVPPGTYNVSFEFAGLRTESYVVELERGQRKEQPGELLVRVDPNVPRGGTIRGTVRDNRTERGVPGAVVTIVDQGVVDTGGNQLSSDPDPDPPHGTDGSGEYLINGVPPGTFTVEATAPGYLSNRARLTMSADGVAEVAIRLQPLSTVSGVVRSAFDGRPITDAVVKATVVSTGQEIVANPVLDTGENPTGGYTFPQNLTPGSYIITASVADGRFISGSIPVEIVAGQDVPNLNFALDRLGRLRLFVSQPAEGGTETADGVRIEIDSGGTPTAHDRVVDEYPEVFELAPEPATHTVRISDDDGDASPDDHVAFELPPFTAPLNTVTERYVVLAPDIEGTISGRIVYLFDGVPTLIDKDDLPPAVQVSISGTFAYRAGTSDDVPPTPIPSTRTFSAPTGTFTIDRERPPEHCDPVVPGVLCGRVPLDQVGIVVVQHPHFETFNAGFVNFAAIDEAGGQLPQWELQALPQEATGEVTFSDDNPGGKAEVVITNAPPGGGAVEVTTTQVGNRTDFVLSRGGSPDVPVGTYRLRISRGGYVTQDNVLLVVRPGQAGQVSVQLLRTGNITVSARSCPDDATCPTPTALSTAEAQFRLVRVDTGAVVEVKPAVGSASETAAQVTFEDLDTTKEYRVEFVPAATPELRLRGGFPVVTHAPVDELLPGATAQETIEFTRLGRLDLQLVGNTAGTEVPLGGGVTVSLTGTLAGVGGDSDESCQPIACTAVTNAQGVASFRELEAGTGYVIDVVGPGNGYDLADGDITAVAVAGGDTTSRTVVLDALNATLSGLVTDTDGNPLGGVTVRVFPSTGGAPVVGTTSSTPGPTLGRYSIGSPTGPTLLPVASNVEFSLANYGSVTIVGVPLPRGGVFDLPVSLPDRLNSVTGRVTATHGASPNQAALEGATVRIFRISSPAGEVVRDADPNTPGDQPILTGADGSFTIADLEAGSYRFEASKEGYDPNPASFPQVTLRDGDDRDLGVVTLSVRTRTVNVTVRTVAPNGSMAGRVSAAAVRLEPVPDSGAGAVPLDAVSNGSGVATFSNVVPASYNVSATVTTGSIVRTGSAGGVLQVPRNNSSDPIPVDVDMHEGLLRGTAELDGSPASGITITVTNTAGLNTTVPVGEGAYEVYLPAPPTGTASYTVTATRAGSPPVVHQVTITRGAVTVRDVDLVTFGGVDVTVVRSDNAATISSATVTITAAPTAADVGRTFTTNPSGFVNIPNLVPGSYTLQASKVVGAAPVVGPPVSGTISPGVTAAQTLTIPLT